MESPAERIIHDLIVQARQKATRPTATTPPAAEQPGAIVRFPDGSRLILDPDSGEPRLDLDFAAACDTCGTQYTGPAALVLQAARWCEADHDRYATEEAAWPYGTYAAMTATCPACSRTIRGRAAELVAHIHSCPTTNGR